MRRFLVALGLSMALVGWAFPTGAAGKSIGGCPLGGGWQLVTVESLGITPEQAVGIASLDGNRDGLTCIVPVNAAAPAPISGAIIFRDNTVSTSG
jgi:hypothetical protein